MNVLLIDDLIDIRFLARFRLEEDPDVHVVGEAAEPGEGLRLAASLEPDAVLTDLFPDYQDVSFVAHLRSALPDACIVVMSSSSPAEPAAERAIIDGADAFLDKGEGFNGIGGRLLGVQRHKRESA